MNTMNIILTSIIVSVGYGKISKNKLEKTYINIDNNIKTKYIERSKRGSVTREVFDDTVESHTKNFRYNHFSQGKTTDEYEMVNIPIVWHIVYNTFEQNILESQLESQITSLNKDYTLTNEDSSTVPEEWQSLMANYSVNFYTHIIRRVYTDKEEWNVDGDDFDKMKFDKYGGSDSIDPEFNLNIWVVNFANLEEGGTLLGYAQFPGDFKNKQETDGVVLNVYATGSIGTLYVGSKGRTATHEIGHWMNLRHIWGDGDCNSDDGLSDTPLASEAHYCGSGESCSYPSTETCGSADMFMNFMDYGSDDIIVMFTEDQMLRSRALFEKGGTRYSIVTQEKSDSDSDITDAEAIVILVILVIGIVIGLFFIGKAFYTCWLKRTIQNTQHIELEEEAGDSRQIPIIINVNENIV